SGHPPVRTDLSPFNPPTNIPRTRAPAAPGDHPLLPVLANGRSPREDAILALTDYPSFRSNGFNPDGTPNGIDGLEALHNDAHPYFANVSPHNAFRDPFVFLLHSNVDRLFALWQTDPAHP